MAKALQSLYRVYRRIGSCLIPLPHPEPIVSSTCSLRIPSPRGQSTWHCLVTSHHRPSAFLTEHIPDRNSQTHRTSRIQRPVVTVFTQACSNRPFRSLHSVQSASPKRVDNTLETCLATTSFYSPTASGKLGFSITSADSGITKKSTSARSSQASMGVEKSSSASESLNEPIPLTGIAELAESGQYKVGGLNQ